MDLNHGSAGKFTPHTSVAAQYKQVLESIRQQEFPNEPTGKKASLGYRTKRMSYDTRHARVGWEL
jgi:hypothetical protein